LSLQNLSFSKPLRNCTLHDDGRKRKTVFSLPGVPYEVKPLIKDQIIPYLQDKFSLNYISTRIVSVVGIPESILADKIENWELAFRKTFHCLIFL
jgi:nicotinamide-nucleotide amidase